MHSSYWAATIPFSELLQPTPNRHPHNWVATIPFPELLQPATVYLHVPSLLSCNNSFSWAITTYFTNMYPPYWAATIPFPELLQPTVLTCTLLTELQLSLFLSYHTYYTTVPSLRSCNPPFFWVVTTFFPVSNTVAVPLHMYKVTSIYPVNQ